MTKGLFQKWFVHQNRYILMWFCSIFSHSLLAKKCGKIFLQHSSKIHFYIFTQKYADIGKPHNSLFKKPYTIKVKKSFTWCKSKKQIYHPEKNSATPKKSFPDWFGHKTSESICFHKDVVIYQRKLMLFFLVDFATPPGFFLWSNRTLNYII